MTTRDFLVEQEIPFKPYPPLRLMGDNSGRWEVIRHNMGTLLLEAPRAAAELARRYKVARDWEDKGNIISLAVALFLLDCRLVDEDGEVVQDDDPLIRAIMDGDDAKAGARAAELVARRWPDVLGVWEAFLL